jgi:hypothetical protein
MQLSHILIVIASNLCVAHGWVSWNGWNWHSNPSIHTNTSTPTNLRPKVPEAISAWKWGGGLRYPIHAGTTGRDCGSGDTWWSDDDDGYNVVDYWTTCNGGWDIDCNSATAKTFPIDLSTWGGGQVLEMDIVMCSNRTWSPAYEPTNDLLYQSTLTHELGHLMGLDHVDVMPVVETMYASYGDAKYSLATDDVSGIRGIYGPCSANDWVIEANQGHSVVKSGQVSCGIDMELYTRGVVGDYWTAPVSLANNRLGGWVYNNTYISWSELDKNHSAILTLIVTGTDGVTRELNYARNAQNWWHNSGWVDMSANPVGYNTWVGIKRNIGNDYLAEYGVRARYVSSVKLKHFAYMLWNQSQNNGATIGDIWIHRDL